MPAADSSAEQVSDGWIDEALRAVPVPAGLVERMMLLAYPASDER